MQFKDRHLKNANGKEVLIKKGAEYPPKGAVFPANIDVEVWVEKLASGNNAIKEPVIKEVSGGVEIATTEFTKGAELKGGLWVEGEQGKELVGSYQTDNFEAEIESADVSEQEVETFVNVTATAHLIAEMDELIEEVETEIYLDNPFEAKEAPKPIAKNPAPKKKKKPIRK